MKIVEAYMSLAKQNFSALGEEGKDVADFYKHGGLTFEDALYLLAWLLKRNNQLEDLARNLYDNAESFNRDTDEIWSALRADYLRLLRVA